MPGSTRDIYTACVQRSRGWCECGCGKRLRAAELDHFFGRHRVPEAVSNCWLITVECHHAKTDNKPDAATWLRKFIAHCKRHGYAEEQARAEARLEWVTTRAAFPIYTGPR